MKITTINKEYTDNKGLSELLDLLPLKKGSSGSLMLYEKRNTVYRYTLTSGMAVIVKQFRKPNIFQSLCYSTFWKNKADKAFFYATKLLEMGINTPKPIAAITYKQFGLVKNYIFISMEDYGQNTEDFVAPNDIPSESPDAAKVLDSLAVFLIKLHEKGFIHGDTNLSNFRFTKKKDDTYNFSVIDTNRSLFLDRPATKEECLHNLYRTTHLRPTLKELVKSYARHRGWNEEETYATVVEHVNNFEKRKARHKKLKKII